MALAIGTIKTNLDTLTAAEWKIINNLAGDFESNIEEVLFEIQNGMLEFGLVGTSREHLHLAHTPDEHSYYCSTCAEVVGDQQPVIVRQAAV